MNFIDLCSGIGGGRLGLEQCGFKCVGYSDTSRLAKITYNLIHTTDNEFFCNNIKKIPNINTPNFDILIAGFPCQSFSVIGRKDGLLDKRGQLIFTICEILKLKQPKYFILENVKGLVTHNKGTTLETILSSLTSSGYKVYHKVLSTLDYGIPQNRKRIYFVGIRNDIHRKDFIWPNSENSCVPLENLFLKDKIISNENIIYLEKYLNNETNKGKFTIQELKKLNHTILDTRMNDLRIYKDKMPTLRAQRDGIYYVVENEIYQLTGIEALLFQGFPLNRIYKLKNVVTDRHLLMQAGNAMSVNVIKVLGETLKKYEEE